MEERETADRALSLRHNTKRTRVIAQPDEGRQQGVLFAGGTWPPPVSGLETLSGAGDARRSVGPMVWFHLSLTEGFDGRTIRTVGPTRVLVVSVPRPEPVAVVGN